VRGFALTLALGIAVSMFTGIVVTRTLLRVFYRPEEEVKPVIQNKNTKSKKRSWFGFGAKLKKGAARV
jgi:multidrug efflux pump subunit AcrB